MMMKPSMITLDLTGCKSLREMHLRIREAFDFPEGYGQNWSAFWDLLSEPRYYTVVEVVGLNSLPEVLKSSGEMIVKLLQRNKEHQEEFIKEHPQFDYRFDYRIID